MDIALETGIDNIPEIARFLNASWRMAYRGIIADEFLDAMKSEDRAAGLCVRVASGGSEILTGREGGALIGVCVLGKSFTEGFHDDGEISAIYLDDAYIGKGYGHELLITAEAHLAQRGFANIVLDVLSENERAIRFYEAHGYHNVGRASVRLGDTDYPIVVYRKVVSYDGQ